MSSNSSQFPPDQEERKKALNPNQSILVQAPAGSGKTDLLTRRFLRLLTVVDDPGTIVAITFTKAAAAEMRNRILSELEKAAVRNEDPDPADEFSMEALAHRALEHSERLNWDLLRMPAQLRISTIDSFCRELALQQPLLSGLGGGLDIAENSGVLYQLAARRTLEKLASPGSDLSAVALNPAIEELLLWRDNGWQEMESLLIEMLRQRDRWMQGFVLSRTPDWDELRDRLERPFARAISSAIEQLNELFDHVPGACDEIMALSRYACVQSGGSLQRDLAELPEVPNGPFVDMAELEAAINAFHCVADLLLTKTGGTFRKTATVGEGFPSAGKREKSRLMALIDQLRNVSTLEAAIARMRYLPPPRYQDDDWQVVRAAFTLLRHAAGELKTAFAEAGVVDFTEISHVAQAVLCGEDGLPTEAAFAVADGIRHLLVDEFQDTSRRQHKFIGSLVGAWDNVDNRSLFLVGDPMQSIYLFRDADAELFPRVRTLGLDVPDSDPLPLEPVALTSNFRTAPALVERLNEFFTRVFEENDGSGITFSEAKPARAVVAPDTVCFHTHLDFVPVSFRSSSKGPDTAQLKQRAADSRARAREKQVADILALIRSHLPHVESARDRGDKYRIAVLGRSRSVLEPVASALREAAIPFRAVDLEPLAHQPEVLDALALARALFNGEDRIAWLGVLRAPWCGLSLDDVHALTSNDDRDLLRRPLPDLIADRQHLITEHGKQAVSRLLQAVGGAQSLRASQPASPLGTWLQQVWLRLGGAHCADAAARANLDLLWSSLDTLQGGEPDLLGAGLDSALADLKAQPDPAADGEHGVQLMSIHKAKGLEFEVVIVPDLQAAVGGSDSKLLSWLERGLTSADDSGDVTEFLVAPLPSKGAESGKARDWVNRVYREREAQETRRLLYVAATRAREELHLFVRPEYKTKNGSLELSEPSRTLFATAWPALGGEVRNRFADWISTAATATITAIAATANVLPFPAPQRPAILWRLPLNYASQAIASTSPHSRPTEISGRDSTRLYQRHLGGHLSRAIGSAVHLFLEELARSRATSAWEPARTAMMAVSPRVTAALRSKGIPAAEASRQADRALTAALDAARNPIAQWIVSPHPDGENEVRWTGVLAGNVREVRVDRVFRAGPEPGLDGTECWWIIDYKTTHIDEAVSPTALLNLREQFRAQLELYTQVLRKLHGENLTVRAGLYYPRMQAFDWWIV